MLSALLPGLREFRTPLAIGALWLAFVWVIFGEALDKSADVEGSLPFRVLRAVDGAPISLSVAALAFTAYALGAAAGMTNPPAFLNEIFEEKQFDPYGNSLLDQIGRWLGASYRDDEERVTADWSSVTYGVALRYWLEIPEWLRSRTGWRRRLPETLRWRMSHLVNRSEAPIRRVERAWSSLGIWLKPPRQFGNVGYRVKELIDSQIETLGRSGASIIGIFETQALTPYAQRAAGDIIGHAYAMPAPERDAESQEGMAKDVIAESLLDSIEYDLPSVATKLQESESELFDTFDRLRSESEFRIGASLPLAVLGVGIGLQYESAYALSLVAVALVLFVRGWKLSYEAQSLLWSAVLYGLVPVPELENLKDLELDPMKTAESEWEAAMQGIKDRGFSYDPEVGLVSE